MPSVEVRQLRANLILEEALETITALGFTVQKDEVTNQLRPFAAHTPNIVEVVDGCADISVVTIGTLSAFGVGDMPILEAVDTANLGKFGPGSYKREDGKWVKTARFQARRHHEFADRSGLLRTEHACQETLPWMRTDRRRS